ncbi:NADH-ubiquinone/plastoquinone oxidoreductase (mitochondrion) [Aspergillus oryzae 100-8]|uniref:NADH-ubiquinone oxidoreductase chain 6 n=1 Tax=Aspergillus oryzae (strain 3.042) TaxID=1160506 RepID=I6U0U0_ASPO3|nr:NADH dehydrogenase subunit 6 [Aspergillus oryzae 3.042]AFM82520.1 NADH dehydrogenase subunit 6 [Aspergillus oryzae 3.042]KDE74997.1 NADH-ubiquinone/plastoquinone oxidoreductase [Aspergillus oryzae 100-8]|eukprot:AFM82520.1 NADH dehydrogenase subunit 6 (mitochondrion) [Aspergillus oryzae 3.042]
MNNIFLLNDYITNGFRIEFVDVIYLISILFGVLTIVSRNPIVSVLFLIGLFVNIAGLLILVGCNYIGLSYILVYVGAVSILFLFILMLINIRISELLSETNNDIPLAVLTVLLFYYIIGQVLPSNLTDNTIVSSLSNSFSEVYNVQLDNEFLNMVNLKHEIAYANSSLVEFTHITGIGNIISVILLLGMVGAIVITIKQK